MHPDTSINLSLPLRVYVDVALDGPSTVEDWGWLESTEATGQASLHQH
jgi:hypothetical protein